MNKSQEISWKRLSAEAAVIVGSILLAFAIDAWWDERQDRVAEQIALSSLLNDFQANRRELTLRIQQLESFRSAFRDFVIAEPEEIEQLTLSDVQDIPSRIVGAATFDAYLGTLDAITADGRLALMRNDDIRVLLSKWSKTVEDSEEDIIRIQASGSRAAQALEPYGGPFLSDRLSKTGPPASEIFLPATPSVLAALRRDSSFVDIARSHQAEVSTYLSQIRGLENILNDLVPALEQNIRE